MANNSLDVTTTKGDVKGGALWYAPKGTTPPELEELGTELGSEFKRLGFASEDGTSNEIETDGDDKKVWGGIIVGKTQTSFKETYTLRFACSTDLDVLKIVYGDANVTEDTGKTNAKILHKAGIAPEGVFVVKALTDDGRPRWFVIPKGVPQRDISVDYTDGDITVYEVTVDANSDDNGVSSYELLNTVPKA